MSEKLRYWLPALVWMAFIFYFSTDTFSGDNTGSYLEKILEFLNLSTDQASLEKINYIIRKSAHFTEYGILSALLYRAFRGAAPQVWRSRWAISTCVVLALYALLDEFHQTFTTTRSASIYDSGIDFAGGLTVLVLIRIFAGLKKG